MKLICPACGQKATRVSATFGDESAAYCGNCGWNAGLAAKKLRSAVSTTWFVIIFGALLSAFVWYRSSLAAALAVGCAFILFPLSFALLTQERVRRVERIRDQSGTAALANRSMEPVPRMEIAQEVLRYERRPRRARLSWRGWMYSAGVFALCLLMIGIAHLIYRDAPQSVKSGKGFLVVVAFGYYLWLCASFFTNRWKEARLLTDGSFARGVVLVQKDVNRSFPRITYAFRDSLGRQFQKKVTDFSSGLFEQMPVCIFYDDREPSRSMALEGSLFRLLD